MKKLFLVSLAFRFNGHIVDGEQMVSAATRAAAVRILKSEYDVVEIRGCSVVTDQKTRKCTTKSIEELRYYNLGKLNASGYNPRNFARAEKLAQSRMIIA